MNINELESFNLVAGIRRIQIKIDKIEKQIGVLNDSKIV